MITSGISLNGKQRSGLSSRRALIGILGSRASPGSCTIARPPACSIAMSPCVPSTAPRQYDSDDARAIYARRRPEEGIRGRPRVILLRTLVQSNEADRGDLRG